MDFSSPALSRRAFLQLGTAGLAASALPVSAAAGAAPHLPASKTMPSQTNPTRRSNAPNILFIITDQQRWDTIAALGASWMHTPNLDRLVREGVTFERAYCPAPSCVASRHALMTGYFPPTTGVFSFDKWTGKQDWGWHFRQAGYQTASIGKVHYQPRRDEPAWWQSRVVVENKAEGLMPSIHGGKTLDDWGKYLATKGIPKPPRRDLSYPDFSQRLGAFAWEYEEADHSDIWTGDRALEWIRHNQKEEPFFLWVGFPGPHEPYDPPARFLRQYEGKTIPPAHGHYHDLEDPTKRLPWETKAYADFIENGDGDHQVALSQADAPRIEQTRRHYYANVTAIDEKVGMLLDALEKKGQLENTIIVFTSDHGDALFDHGLVYKWNPYEGSVRVPLIVRYPKAFAQGVRTQRPTSLLDIVPPLFEQAGLPVPPNRQWKSASAVLEGKEEVNPPKYAYCVHGSDQFNPSTWILVVSEDWKLVYYVDSESRELYNLKADPGELKNLAFDAAHREKRAEMENEALRWFASTTRQGSALWSAEIR